MIKIKMFNISDLKIFTKFRNKYFNCLIQFYLSQKNTVWSIFNNIDKIIEKKMKSLKLRNIFETSKYCQS